MACGGMPSLEQWQKHSDEAEVLPLTARDLLEGHSAAWQVFLAYAASCFPNVGPLAQEEFSLALAEGEIADAGEQVALATKASLEHLNRGAATKVYNALGAPRELLERCEMEATKTLRELQLSLLRKSRDHLLQALQEATASSEQAGAVLCEIRQLKEAALERRANGHGRRAQRLLEDTEAAVARLKECRQQKVCLLRARKARLCRAEDVTSLSVGVLVFRGRHRLHIQRCQGVPLTPSSLCWLRFQAAAPGRKGSLVLRDGIEAEDPEPGPEWRRRFEEALCHLWIRAVDTNLAEAKARLLPFSEVPSLIHRLQVGLLQAGDFLQAVAKQRRQLQLPAPEVNTFAQ